MCALNYRGILFYKPDMDSNQILYILRETFDLSDKELIDIFHLGGLTVTAKQLDQWFEDDDPANYADLPNDKLTMFLNGFIIHKRGQKEGSTPPPIQELNNNIVFKKIKIALNLQASDILEIFAKREIEMSNHQLSAMFRNPKQSQYRPCSDYTLKNFLLGMRQKYLG